MLSQNTSILPLKPKHRARMSHRSTQRRIEKFGGESAPEKKEKRNLMRVTVVIWRKKKRIMSDRDQHQQLKSQGRGLLESLPVRTSQSLYRKDPLRDNFRHSASLMEFATSVARLRHRPWQISRAHADQRCAEREKKKGSECDPKVWIVILLQHAYKDGGCGTDAQPKHDNVCEVVRKVR